MNDICPFCGLAGELRVYRIMSDHPVCSDCLTCWYDEPNDFIEDMLVRGIFQTGTESVSTIWGTLPLGEPR